MRLICEEVLSFSPDYILIEFVLQSNITFVKQEGTQYEMTRKKKLKKSIYLIPSSTPRHLIAIAKILHIRIWALNVNKNTRVVSRLTTSFAITKCMCVFSCVLCMHESIMVGY